MTKPCFALFPCPHYYREELREVWIGPHIVSFPVRRASSILLHPAIVASRPLIPSTFRVYGGANVRHRSRPTPKSWYSRCGMTSHLIPSSSCENRNSLRHSSLPYSLTPRRSGVVAGIGSSLLSEYYPSSSFRFKVVRYGPFRWHGGALTRQSSLLCKSVRRRKEGGSGSI
jgi:hypothetical protein